jgi:hypothetical protein
MKFELLPNEIFIECFEYLNVFEIYCSFDELNFRFNQLIRNIPLHIDFQNVRKKIFDQFCIKILSNPEIQNQIISLKLSNKDTCGQIDAFLSFFSLDKFSHLQSLTLIQVKETNIDKLESMLPLIPQLYSFRLIDSQIEIFNLPFSKLQTLSMPRLNFLPAIGNNTSSIINLTISYCSFDKFYLLFQYIPMLKYLNVQRIADYNHSQDTNTSFPANKSLHLKELILTEMNGTFDDLEFFVKQTPNLTNLIISSSDNIDMINARRWENLIKSSLSCLDIFKFRYSYHNNNNRQLLIEKFKQFESDFWQKEHHWYIEYSLSDYFSQIYTMPYVLKTFELIPSTKRYGNQLMNTFNNVKDLILRHGAITEDCQYQFFNVKSLKIEYLSTSSKIHVNYFQTLTMLVNLSHVKQLDITWNNTKELPLFLLNILKEAPSLSSISIDADSLILLFENKELCEYLNKMIQKWNICKSGYSGSSTFDKIKQFCQICPNIEQLRCYINQWDDLLFLLNRLSKLSTMTVSLFLKRDYEHFNLWMEKEAQKLNFRYYINNSKIKETELTVWKNRDRN